MKRMRVLAVSVIVSLILTVGLCGCDSVVRNAKSFSCFGDRADSISFNIKTKLSTHEPGLMRFKTDAHGVEDMMDRMKAASPQYEYGICDYGSANVKAGIIFNNSQTRPGNYMLLSDVCGDFNFILMPMTIHCASAQEIAFPYHLLYTAIDLYEVVSDGSVFAVKCGIDDIAEFYRKNNYTVDIEDNVLKITDNIKPDLSYSNESSEISIRYTGLDATRAIIEYAI